MMKTAQAFFEQGIAFHRGGDLTGAEQAYRSALDLDDRDPRATQMLGVLAFQTGRAGLAVDLLRRAAELAPASAECHGNLGLVLAESGRPAEAVSAYRRAIALKPDFGEAHVNLGNALRAAGDLGGAVDAYRHGAAACPELSAAHYNLGLLLADANRLDESIAALRQACRLQPRGSGEHAALAATLLQRGDLTGALAAYRRVVALQPESADAWNNQGTLLDRLGRSAEARDAYLQAIRFKADLPEAHYNLANTLHDLGQTDDAIATIGKALAMNGNWPEAWNNLGVWLLEANRPAEAADALARAIAARPTYAEAHANYGSVVRHTGDLPGAIACYRRAIGYRPDYAEAMSNLGAVLERTGAADEAIAVLRRAIALRSDLSETHNNLGNALKETGDVAGALAAYARATEVQPTNAVAGSNAVYTLLYHADATPADHRDAAVAWARRHADPLRPMAPAPRIGRDRRARVGYVAPDFRNHCQSFFTVPLLSNHDRERFEVVCYADVAAPDTVTARIRGLTEHWRDVAGMSDAALADQIRADGIDVLVDLTVHMAQHRLLTFARRPAPVQVTWLGYPGTTGIAAIDYRLSDPHLDPPGHDGHYTERTVRLPDSFWCYDPLTDGPLVNDLPADRNGFVTFGCLNNFCKVTDGTLALWGRVMAGAARSRLVMLAPQGSARQRVLAALGAQGIDAERVTFVPRQSRQAYLATYHQIDVGLDTFPYNGHTTSLDSYWMGVPVVTAVGTSAVGRAGWSQLTNLGLTELAAAEGDGFVAVATALAHDPGRLRALRSTLRARLAASPLCDGPRFARNVESAYRRMLVAAASPTTMAA